MIRNPFAAKTGRRLHTSTARAVTLGSAAVLALGLTASLGLRVGVATGVGEACRPRAHGDAPARLRPAQQRCGARSQRRATAGLAPSRGQLAAQGPRHPGCHLDRPAHRHRPQRRQARRVPHRPERAPSDHELALGYLGNPCRCLRPGRRHIASLQLRRDYVENAGTHHLSFIQHRRHSVSATDQANVTKDGRLVNVVGSPVTQCRPLRGPPVLRQGGPDPSGQGRRPPCHRPHRQQNRRLPRAPSSATATPRRWSTSAPRPAPARVADADLAALAHVHARGRRSSRPGALPAQPRPARQRPRLGQLPRRAEGRHPAARNLTRPGWLPPTRRGWRATSRTSTTTSTTTTWRRPPRRSRPGARRSTSRSRTSTPRSGRPAPPTFQCSWDPEPRTRGGPTASRTRCRSSTSSASSTTTSAPPDRLHPRGGQLRGGRRRRHPGPADDGANTADGLPGRQPHRQRQHGHPAGRHPAADADVPVPRPGRPRPTRSCRPTAATRPTSSTTSTPTACPTGSSSTPTATRRWATSRPARWARPGATGTPWTSWPTQGSSGHRRARRGPGRRLRRHRPGPDPHPAAGLPGRLDVRGAPARRARAPAATPTATSADHRPARGARRRRDLGRDALGPAQRARQQGCRVAGHPGDGAVAGQPVVPRHAQLDPPGRPGHGQGQRTRKIWKVFAKRGMGYFAGSIDGDDTAPVEDFSLPPAAGTPTGSLTGRVRRQRHGRTGGERDRRLRRPRLRLPGRLRGHDRRGRHLHDRRDLRRHLPEGLRRRHGFDRQVRTACPSARARTRRTGAAPRLGGAAGGASVADFNATRLHRSAVVPRRCSTSRRAPAGARSAAQRRRQARAGLRDRRAAAPIDVSEIAIDPTATCGDAGSASTGRYSSRPPPTARTWTRPPGDFTPADRGMQLSAPGRGNHRRG